jgi:hypothetical protein
MKRFVCVLFYEINLYYLGSFVSVVLYVQSDHDLVIASVSA